MNGENQPLITDEPDEFENIQLKFKTSWKLPIIYLFNIYNLYFIYSCMYVCMYVPQINKESPKDCNM